MAGFQPAPTGWFCPPRDSWGQRIGGRIPYGFKLADDGARLIEEPVEQRVLATIQQMRAAGGTARDIEKELQRCGRGTDGIGTPRCCWICAGANGDTIAAMIQEMKAKDRSQADAPVP